MLEANTQDILQSAVREKFVPSLTLLTSLGTLVCCTILCLLAVVSHLVAWAHMADTFPDMVEMVQNTNEIMALSFGMLAVNSIMAYIIRSNFALSRSSRRSPRMDALRLSETRFTKFVLIIGWVIWFLGFVFTV